MAVPVQSDLVITNRSIRRVVLVIEQISLWRGFDRRYIFYIKYCATDIRCFLAVSQSRIVFPYD